MADEWYRDPHWNRRIEEEFELRLGRARGYNRPQYLRIKALALLENGAEKERIAARDLLRRVIEEYDDPLNSFDLLIAREVLGKLYESEGALDEAEAQYRAALRVSLENNVRGDAHLRLTELLIQEDKLADAEVILDSVDPEHDLTFKSQRFRYSVCRARLAAADGNEEGASAYAAAALQEAGTEAPDFPRHHDIGHVHADEGLLRELKDLAR